jgi:hypothetical protein
MNRDLVARGTRSPRSLRLLVMSGRFTHPIPGPPNLDMTRRGGLRVRPALVLALALLSWIAASRSSMGDHPLASSSRADAEAIESVPTPLVPMSDRQILSPGGRSGESPSVLSVIAVSSSAVGAAAAIQASVRSSPSFFSAGPLAQGLAGRGPPPSSDA